MKMIKIFNEKHYSIFIDFENAVNEYLKEFSTPDNYVIEYILDSRDNLIVVVEHI